MKKYFAIFLFAFLVGALGYTIWDPKELECIDELKLNKDEIQTLNAALYEPIPIYNKNLNAFLECSWRKKKTLDGNGGIIWERVGDVLEEDIKTHLGKDPTTEDVIAAVIASEAIMEAIEECQGKDVQGSSPGETIARFQNCFGFELRIAIENAKNRN